ncbi:hypothetical protein PENANT_c056G02142 [Penicillium antarcticum]|uniref:Uncharacterized protein n=1 Tax=Penicillium antarcticum TaxID=416450 RepID=A0A1V6PQK4_9EURO|nr:uncharacterized protein N7508_011130 [Penicillium antarcticum]XP_058314217.1 uncharacterized protein N7508_011179 [Penicillium antarcticum]KAJ5288355.1 hypothetical protein N7508_011130 [Penicillium antarcticum]KAJ5288404.1 hypothetical protein N7508_011179 [Penicillium antarcticum]OQD79265.1 hypothetical protein PENANT_c056G02142 [Penicillium antarcticum]
MVFYEGSVIGDPAVEALRQHLAASCLDGRTYEHVEPIAEPLFSEAGGGSPYRLMWDGVMHFANAKLYTSAVDDALEESEGTSVDYEA